MPEAGNPMDVHLAVVQVWLRPECAWWNLRRGAAVTAAEIVPCHYQGAVTGHVLYRPMTVLHRCGACRRVSRSGHDAFSSPSIT